MSAIVHQHAQLATSASTQWAAMNAGMIFTLHLKDI